LGFPSNFAEFGDLGRRVRYGEGIIVVARSRSAA